MTERLPSDKADENSQILVRAGNMFVLVVQFALAIEATLLVLGGHYFSAFLAAGVVVLPLLFRHIGFRVPAELQLAAILFAFGTLFLGEVRDYYERFWWWDLSIHFTSGLLLGLFGFMVVYIMNENRAVDLHMRPSFIAFFAFAFAVAVGAGWEVFEFAVDRTFGTNMQKPRWGDDSGLTDTMMDLIVDIAGAALVSVFGWRHVKAGPNSWLRRMVTRNPQLFGAD